MKVAVLTLTRDRLDYTRHCFDALWDNAGCEFDHYVLDQASTDGTAEWLRDAYEPFMVGLSDVNLGISVGMNHLIDNLDGDYDVVVKFDNDCELVTRDTLSRVCSLVMDTGWLLSPRILGLNNPPAVIGYHKVGEEHLLQVRQIGGIFLAASAEVYRFFRYSDRNPVWGADDVEICRGRPCGYVDGIDAWHYESTSGQHKRYPAYFERTLAEGKPAL